MTDHQINVKDETMKTRRCYLQGDLCVVKLSDDEASHLAGTVIKPPVRGSIRLLEGEVTGHHHEIVLDRGDHGEIDSTEAEAIAAAALAVAKARASIGKATLFADAEMTRRLPWLLRADLMIGFLSVEGAPVTLKHPEHDAIRIPSGVYYVGRQIESAGADERQVQD